MKKSITCEDIPDTKKLQEIRLSALDKQTGDERFMQEHYPVEYKTPRITTLTVDERRRIYSLVFPLSFSLPESFGSKVQTHFGRWSGNSRSYDGSGAMNLTTGKGLDELISIFSKNNLPIRPGPASGNVFGRWGDRDCRCEAGINVPYGWQVDTYDPNQSIINHQFVVCEQTVMGVPFKYVIREKMKNVEKGKVTTVVEKKEHCEAYFYPKEHPDFETYLLKRLEEKAQEQVGEDRYEGKVVMCKLNFIGLGEPKLVYDPSWVNHQ